MAQPALTIASLIKDPALRTAAPMASRAHTSFDLGEMADPGLPLESRWAAIRCRCCLSRVFPGSRRSPALSAAKIWCCPRDLGSITGQLDFHAAASPFWPRINSNSSVTALMRRSPAFLRRDQNNDQASRLPDHSAAPWTSSVPSQKTTGLHRFALQT